jgi:hypothetical protein
VVLFPVEARDFSLLYSIQTGCMANPVSYIIIIIIIIIRDSFLGVKRPGREANH